MIHEVLRSITTYSCLFLPASEILRSTYLVSIDYLISVMDGIAPASTDSL